MNHNHHGNESQLELMAMIPFGIILLIYIFLAIASSQHYKSFPLYRYLCWILGVLCVAASVVGPLAVQAHTDFSAHMIVHVLLGMLAPLLLTLAAPMTLLLRTLSLKHARRLSCILKRTPFRLLNNPIVASILNIGGLWILYTTDLYSMMQQSVMLHFLVHIHVFFAGYLFTTSMIYIDPTPHRTSFVYRSLTLLLALASHGILSKHLYSNPPSGVPVDQAEYGSMLMYYGGDIVDIFLIVILFLQWFNATRPKATVRPLANKV